MSCAPSYSLGAAATISNHNFEIMGVLAGTGVNGVDADPALVINDFLTNPQYGVGFDPASIDATTLFGAGGDASLQTYCRAMGFAFSPALTGQEQGSSILSRWLQILSCAAVWSGGELKFIPYGDTADRHRRADIAVGAIRDPDADPGVDGRAAAGLCHGLRGAPISFPTAALSSRPPILR